MKRHILFLLFVILLTWSFGRQFSSPATAQQNSISVSIFSPSAGGLGNTNLSIAVAVNSVFQVAAVKASVEGRETTLAYSTCAYIYPRITCNAGYVGTISLAGLPRGPHQLMATATDVFNNTASAQPTFNYDQPPQLTISAPLAETVARPILGINVVCTDDDPVGCNNLLMFFNNTSVIYQPDKGEFHGELSLAQFQGQSGDLCISARDSANQTVKDCRPIYVESSPMLTEVASVGGKIWDVQDDRVLFSIVRNGREVLKTLNRTTGAETELVMLTDSTLHDSSHRTVYLTPGGAIFSVKTDSDSKSKLLEWRDGELLDLGEIDSSDSIQVAGDYAIWTRGRPTTLLLRNLATGSTQEIANGVGNWLNDVTADGQVVFWSGNYEIRRYREGQITQLSNPAGSLDIYPLTDGQNVVFYRRKGTMPNSPRDVVLWTMNQETVLSTLNYDYPDRLFAINNGWVAFARAGQNGGAQVWLRSASGQEMQKSFFQAAAYPDALSPTGELSFVVFDSNQTQGEQKRFMPISSHPPLTVGSSLGRAFWQDGKLFVILGRSLFQFAPLASVSAASFSGAALATESIASVFGSQLATSTQVATMQPLPTTLAGTTVSVRDSMGMSRPAPLFFVSPTQINYQIPPGTSDGQALVTINSGGGTASSGVIPVVRVAPSLFTANASGLGVPAAVLLRVMDNGEQIYEPVAFFDQSRNQFVPRPIEPGPESEQLFLILFGTGFRYRSALSNTSATIAGTNVQVQFAGAQNEYAGLDQVNISLPRSLAGRGEVDLRLMVDQQTANTVTINMK